MASSEMETLDAKCLITDAHLCETLARDKGNQARLASWTVEDFTKKGDNYATVVTSVSVKYYIQGEEHKESYVVKLNLQCTFSSSESFGSTMFKKEAEFLEKIKPLLSSELEAVGQSELRMAKCYHTSLETMKELIILEDLRQYGFQMCDRMKGLDVAHTNLVLQELARLHASSLLLKAKDPNQNLADRFDYLKQEVFFESSLARNMISQMTKHSIEQAKSLLCNREGFEVAEQWLTKHKDNPITIFEKHLISKPQFEVICHGDCWNNNLLFRYNAEGDPTEVMLVDLQICRLSSLANDLAQLLHTSLHGDIRKANIGNFLATYYNAFSKVMEAGEVTLPFTLQELHQEYKDKQDYGLMFGVMSLNIILAEDHEILDLGNLKEGDLPELMEECYAKGRDKFKLKPDFKSRFLALFNDMVEHGTVN